MLDAEALARIKAAAQAALDRIVPDGYWFPREHFSDHFVIEVAVFIETASPLAVLDLLTALDAAERRAVAAEKVLADLRQGSVLRIPMTIDGYPPGGRTPA